MYPITNEVMALFEAEQRKVLRITGTDKNGATISITDNDVIADSFQVDRYSCNGEKLEVGTAIAAQMSLTLENGGGQYNGIVFEGAELFVEVGIADWTQSSPTITYVPCGYFTPDEQPRRLSTISITGLDQMTKFDVVVDAADLTFPTTVAGLVGQVCTLCSVTLAQSISGLVNASVAVTELPTAQEEITYRNLIQWCAGIMGTNAWFDWNGQLRFSWYENVTGYVSTVDNRYSSDLYEDDLTVSGVEYTNDSGIVIVEGTDDYAIDLTGNAIVGPLVATVLPPLNTALNGFTYRPFTAAAVNAPYLWPMDIVTFTDKDGNDHTSVLTNVAFGLNGTTAMESKGMTYAINKLAQPKGFTREQAQLVNQAMEHVEQDIDESLTQQDIFNRLTDNGAAQGLVLYNGQLYVNASYIKAGTLTLGGANNVNGMMQVLDASGNVIGTWNKDGITLNKGTVAGPSVTVGGANNANGVMQVLDANGNVVVTLNNNGADISNGSIIHYSSDKTYRAVLSDGFLKFQYYNSAFQPIGWRNILNLSKDNSAGYEDASITTVGNLRINGGGGLVLIENKTGGSDTDTAAVQLDEDKVLLLVSNYGANTWLSVAPAVIQFSIDDNIGDPYVFELSKTQSSNPLSVGNGGTGATTAANARAKLGVTPANIGAKAVQSAVSDPTASGTAVAFIDSISQNAQGVISPTKKTVQSASQSAAGLMSAADKTKLDGIEAGAQVNSVTGVKGNAESSYRTGNVNITLANIGAAADSAAMQYRGWYPNGESMLSLTPGYYRTSPNNLPSETFPSGINAYGTLCVDNTGYTHITYIGVLGDFMIWKANATAAWYVVQRQGVVLVSSGGTGATTAAGARTNLGIATTVTTVTTTGITSNGNWISDLLPNNVVIDAAYCAAGTVAVTPYCNSAGKWAFHCINVSTGAAYGTAFDLTIRYHSIY